MKQNSFFTSAYGVNMPSIIYGTAWKKLQTAELVTQAIDLGFRGIDTACQPKHYNEPGVGVGIAASLKAGLPRSELFIQSKFTPLNGQDPLQVPYDSHASLSKQVAQSFQTSLKNLQIDYLDSLVLHSPLADTQQFLEVWQAMEQIFENGGSKQLGLSNCYDLNKLEYLYRSASIKPAVLQNRFYADTHYDRTIRDFCREHHIIYQSFWTLTANPKVLSSPLLKKLADKYQRSSALVFFNFLNHHGIIPLTGTTSVAHMQEDLGISDFNLEPEDCAAIDLLLLENV